MKRVAIALSGGVDSLVAAILLKRSGWSDHSISSRVQSGLIREGASLVGVFMRNWEERDEGRGQRCTAEADYSRVRDICAALNIPCALADFVKDYWNDVFRYQQKSVIKTNENGNQNVCILIRAVISYRPTSKATPPIRIYCATDTSSSVHYIATVVSIWMQTS